MYMSMRENIGKQLGEFGRPVETIMKCEDFKSNFARRFSNRFRARSPLSSVIKDSNLKSYILESNELKGKHLENLLKPTAKDNEPKTDDYKEIQLEVPIKQVDNSDTKNADIRYTKVTALNMEVETLRWQLAQTEANRQMHVELLKQLVSFLNRVKDHIDCKQDVTNEERSRIVSKSVNVPELPRSKSVLHVNKRSDSSVNTYKKLSSRKISKSISNVSAFHRIEHDICEDNESGFKWKHSKMFINIESNYSQKITEEITRLIVLSNTVLDTKLPDLACSCNKPVDERKIITLLNGNNSDVSKLEQSQANDSSIGSLEKDISTVLNPTSEKSDMYENLTDKYVESSDISLRSFEFPQSPLLCGLENNLDGLKLHPTDIRQPLSIKNFNESSFDINKPQMQNEKSQNSHIALNLLEDESGFSSMTSFQEIGIPVINVTPPTPCKENVFSKEQSAINGTDDNWKTETLELDKQSMKVFWV